MRRRLAWVVLAALSTGGCGEPEPGASSLPEADRVRPREAAEPGTAAPPAPPLAAGGEGPPLVVFLGDSLTAGLGLGEDQAYPAVVAERLEEAGVPVRVVNAGVSGDTSAGGLRRLSWVLRQAPAVVVVGLGANDGLRGLALEETDRNLREIVRRARETGAEVVLLGMRIPPNYGPEYAEAFAALYPRIAGDLAVPFVPFLLEGVGGEPELNLPDGMHPNARGHERLAANVLPPLHAALTETAGSGLENARHGGRTLRPEPGDQ